MAGLDPAIHDFKGRLGRPFRSERTRHFHARRALKRMEDAFKSFLAAIGAVFAVGGGVATVAYVLLRFFGEKWLSAKFEERLAAYKHAQQKELEQLRFKISALMDRTTKLHQKEFDVLPEAWGKLSDAYGIILALTSALQQYPDLDRMNESHLDEFLKESPLMSWQKDEIKATGKKTDYYIKAIAWHKISKARDACRELDIYLRKNGIFIPEPTKSKFTELDKLIFDTLVEHEINEQDQVRPRLRESSKKLGEQGGPLIKALEQEIQNRLWNSEEARP
jgi:hypothetical protein